jgi:hypothetical protein
MRSAMQSDTAITVAGHMTGDPRYDAAGNVIETHEHAGQFKAQ